MKGIDYVTETNTFRAFYLSIQQMGILFAHARDETNISVRRHLLFLNALRRVFKRAIYVVRKILLREMKDYNNLDRKSVV